jgi:hypothetical protein
MANKKQTTTILLIAAAAAAVYLIFSKSGAPAGPQILPASSIPLPQLAVQGSATILNDIAKSVAPAPYAASPLTPNPTLTPLQPQPTVQDNIISVASNYPSLQDNPNNPIQTTDPTFGTIYDI